MVVIGSPNVKPGYRLVDNKDYPEIADDYARTFGGLETAVRHLPRAHGEYCSGLPSKYERLKAAKEGEGIPFLDPDGYPRLRRTEGESVPGHAGGAERQSGEVRDTLSAHCRLSRRLWNVVAVHLDVAIGGARRNEERRVGVADAVVGVPERIAYLSVARRHAQEKMIP